MFSTDPDFVYKQQEDEESPTGVPPQQQQLRVLLEKKGRGGKTVTLVTNFEGNDLELAMLGKSLRQQCGVGGSAKEGEIVLQGDVRQKAVAWLQAQGYKAKAAGG